MIFVIIMEAAKQPTVALKLSISCCVRATWGQKAQCPAGFPSFELPNEKNDDAVEELPFEFEEGLLIGRIPQSLRGFPLSDSSKVGAKHRRDKRF